MIGEQSDMSFIESQEAILHNLDAAHGSIYSVPVFDGPSLHFHLKALNASRRQILDQFTEYVYAALVSWGMHRMGRKGSKMTAFEVFAASIRSVFP